jgi:SHS2 domain-containing protein
MHPMKVAHGKGNNYTIIPHASDICIEVQGSTIKEVFKKGAIALMDQMISKGKNERTIVRHIDIKAPDKDLLFVYWLQEMLYQFYVHGYIYNRSKINKLTETELKAIVTFNKFSPKKHKVKREIKAVTHHDVNIMEKNNKYTVRFVIDI